MRKIRKGVNFKVMSVLREGEDLNVQNFARNEKESVGLGLRKLLNKGVVQGVRGEKKRDKRRRVGGNGCSGVRHRDKLTSLGAINKSGRSVGWTLGLRWGSCFRNDFKRNESTGRRGGITRRDGRERSGRIIFEVRIGIKGGDVHKIIIVISAGKGFDERICRNERTFFI